MFGLVGGTQHQRTSARTVSVVTISSGSSCSLSAATAAATKAKGEAKETGTICLFACGTAVVIQSVNRPTIHNLNTSHYITHTLTPTHHGVRARLRRLDLRRGRALPLHRLQVDVDHLLSGRAFVRSGMSGGRQSSQ